MPFSEYLPVFFFLALVVGYSGGSLHAGKFELNIFKKLAIDTHIKNNMKHVLLMKLKM